MSVRLLCNRGCVVVCAYFCCVYFVCLFIVCVFTGVQSVPVTVCFDGLPILRGKYLIGV